MALKFLMICLPSRHMEHCRRLTPLLILSYIGASGHLATFDAESSIRGSRKGAAGPSPRLGGVGLV